jgi:hypothetical protein
MAPLPPILSGCPIIDDIPTGIFGGFNGRSNGVTSYPCATSIALEFLDDPDTKVDLARAATSASAE